jgi:hypothetical protein
MSFKKTRNQIYKIPYFLLYALIILVVIGIILSFVAIFFPNPVLTRESLTIFFDSTTNLSNLIVGAIIASIIGLFSSVAIMDLENEKNRDNIILCFYYEIKELKEQIKDIPVNNFQGCVEFIVRNKLKLYSENGFYYALKKELFTLDKPLLEKILEVYPKIIFVDELIPDIGNYPSQPLLATPGLLKIHEYIGELKSKIDVLFQILDEEVKKMEK